MSLYTKGGAPLTVRGDRVYNDARENFGYIQGDRVFGNDGQYRGTIVSGRLIYRSTESARMSSARAPSAGTGGSGRAHSAGSAAWGDEPNTNP
jgi:hypothetical protein